MEFSVYRRYSLARRHDKMEPHQCRSRCLRHRTGL
jgi:hypothetical protein